MSRGDDLWFAFAGVESPDMGVRLARLPAIPSAEARGTAVKIPGRDGALWLPEDAFGEVELRLELELGPEAELEAVAAWLAGSGELTLSNMEEYCWRARVSKGIEWAPGFYAGGRYRGTVAFACDPFRYLPGGGPKKTLSSAGLFSGRGTWPARPAITVYGQGDVSLMVNDVTVLLDGVDGHVTLDCEAMMAFVDGDNVSVRVTLVADGDEWPSLKPAGAGKNRVSWSGDVDRVEIIPNWRWR